LTFEFLLFISPATLLLFSFRCTVYPERSEGHSCTFVSLFNLNDDKDYRTIDTSLRSVQAPHRNISWAKMWKKT